MTTTPSGNDEVGNVRAITYIEPREAKDPKDPKAGIARQKGVSSNGVNIEMGAWLDPWGSEYMVFIDANYDGDLNVGLIYSGISATRTAASRSWRREHWQGHRDLEKRNQRFFRLGRLGFVAVERLPPGYFQGRFAMSE